MPKTKSAPTRLTEQQRYLLQRIPSSYRMDDDRDKQAEPAHVKQARSVIERWDKQQRLNQCKAGKRNEALINKAREAVYFDTPAKALAIIRQCEKMLKGCE